MSCAPILTPSDCGPTATAAPEAVPTVTPEAPPGFPELPAPPPVEQWNLPDAAGLTAIAGNSAIIATATIAILIMTVAVAAARPLDPARLRNFAMAAFVLPVTSAMTTGEWSTPLSLLWSGADTLAAGDWSGLAPMLVVAMPAGMLLAAWWWANFLIKNNSVGQKSLARTERSKAAMVARRGRAAARAAKAGAPFTSGSDVVLGVLAEHVSAAPLGVWRSLTARYQQWLTIPHTEVRRHMAIVATTGAGKTTMLERHALAILTSEWEAWQRWRDVPKMRARHPRPLLVMIACKGGEDDRKLGEVLRDDALALGIARERIGMVVPGGDRLNVWDMPARDLRAVLTDLMVAGESTTSEGQHFDEMRKRIVSLVIDAPSGPPRSSGEFLARLNEQVLIDAWGGAPDVIRQVRALQAEKVPQLDDALIKMSNLFDQLRDHNGAMVFDGGRDLDEMDVLFATVPGMDADAGRAQVAAIIRMVMQRAGRTTADDRRSVTVIIDEASAVATAQGSLGLEQVAERGRSQGVSVTFAAQSAEGLARDQWSLNRLLKACAGGVVIGYSENAGELCKHFGSVRRALPSRHLIKGQRHGDEGQISFGEQWLVDPDRVRQLATGEVVYAKAGHAFYGRVVPVDRTQLRPLPGTTPATTNTATTTATVKTAAA
ncbi:type IV secretory system conjugative DNA transfer family protein [Nocardia puris]|uniref:hypothetical protein n=1 Tax=Nocardia puris TaxID=208602 RepID=UPI002E234989